MNPDHQTRVRIWGDYALFTRPEHKSEQVSYPVPTPTAARGVLEAIYWKPEFTWQIREIDVLAPVRWTKHMVNEVKTGITNKNRDGIVIDDQRTQRSKLLLRDVDYVITAEVVRRDHANKPARAYLDQFERRVQRGACFHRPYLGQREYVASFAPVEDPVTPIDDTFVIGPMVHDIDYDEKSPTYGTATFFHAQLVGGRLNIPEVA